MRQKSHHFDTGAREAGVAPVLSSSVTSASSADLFFFEQENHPQMTQMSQMKTDTIRVCDIPEAACGLAWAQAARSRKRPRPVPRIERTVGIVSFQPEGV